jgi:molybdopterin/thiamine biosynthesis adenylyltransferase
VAFALVRLGVEHVILLDRDTVDASNLNRQILFHTESVDQKKVEACEDALKKGHNLRSKITTIHADAVKEWGAIVSQIKECDAVFNNIDYGSCFDQAVAALCKRQGITYVAGSTYANTIEMSLFKGDQKSACYSCANSISDSFDYKPVEIAAFLKEPEATEITTAQIQSFVATKMNASGPVAADITAQTLAGLGVAANTADTLSLEVFCTKFLSGYKQAVSGLLVPSKITSYTDISFIAQGKPFPTRTVGSWLCVCAGGALFLVNHWVQSLMKTPQDTPVHNWSKMDIGLLEGGINCFGFHVAQDDRCPVCIDNNTNPNSDNNSNNSNNSNISDSTKSTTPLSEVATAP